MLTSYYTLQALAEAWQDDLTECIVGDVYSQARGELTIALAKPDAEWMLKVSVQAPLRYVFRSEGYNRARRNVATLFEDAFDQTVTGIRLADRDRMLFIDLADGRALQIIVFGPRANVLLVAADGTIAEAFQQDATMAGTPAPQPRPAPDVNTFAAFAARWRTDRKTALQATTSAFPFFDKTLAREALHRAGVAATSSTNIDENTLRHIFEAGRALHTALLTPAPQVYWDERYAETFALCPLAHLTDGSLRREAFDDLDAAVRIFVRRSLGQRRFRASHAPLVGALRDAAAHYARSTERMLEQLSEGSRADRYEQWGHLLMATPQSVPPQAKQAILPDLFGGEGNITIPLDPRLDAIGNAERFYAKARQTRQARAHAEDRLLETERRAEEADALLAQVEALTQYRDVERFRKENVGVLARYLGQRAETERLPFRRYPLGQGYEVWVGRNAKQNDQLTFKHAQKYDLWLHARGVPGSHAVLRLPNRQAQPPKPLLERAAAIAAYHSKARGSQLVPVAVTPRKYVRKPRGGAPGAVLLEREEVLLVEPGLPA